MTRRTQDDRIEYAREMGIHTQVAYERILEEAAEIRLSKVMQYGEARYNLTDHDWSMQGIFWDLHRTWCRMEALTKSWRSSREVLRDTLMDTLNYAAMGIQLLDKYAVDEEMPE